MVVSLQFSCHPHFILTHNKARMRVRLCLLAVVVVVSLHSASSAPAPAPAPLFGALINKIIGFKKNLIGAVARPILDVKKAKLGLVRGLLDKKIDLVSRKRNFWG